MIPYLYLSVSLFGAWFLAPLWAFHLVLVVGSVVCLRNTIFSFLSPAETPTGAIEDVVEEAERLKKFSAPFDPWPFINKAPPGHVFLGLQEKNGKRQPVYVKASTLQSNHKALVGESGVGKSSLASIMMGQLWRNGNTVLVFDPKNDRRMPSSLAAFTPPGKKMHVINLNVDQPQVNPLLGATPLQKEEAINSAFSIDPSGNQAVDFHRANDRFANLQVSKHPAKSISELVAALGGDETVTKQENLWRELQFLAEVPAFQTEEGLDLNAAISNGDLIYITGNKDNERLKVAHKLLFQRCLQIISSRDPEDADKRPVCTFLDELKYILSNAALRTAGTIRDRNCHMLVAFQSFGDLEDCAGLSPEAVKGAIWGNAGISFVYRVKENRTARELSDNSGMRRVWTENKTKTKSETLEEGGWRESSKPHVSVSSITHLPKPDGGSPQAAVSYVMGLGPAFLLSSRWAASNAKPPAPYLAKPLPAAVQSAKELI